MGDAWKVKSVLMINVNFERLDLFQWDAWNQFGSINPADSFNLNVIKPQTTNVRHLNSNRSIQWLESKMKIDFKFNFNNGFLHYCSACWFVKCYIIIYSWPIQILIFESFPKGGRILFVAHLQNALEYNYAPWATLVQNPLNAYYVYT